MKIRIPRNLDQAGRILQAVDCIRVHVCARAYEPALPRTRLWLGSSDDRQLWCLLAHPSDPADAPEHFQPQHLVAWLAAPPKGHDETIGNLLTAAYVALLTGERLDADRLQSIIAAHPFPVYRTVAEYLPEAPAEWLALPAEIDLSIGLSEWGGVNWSVFEHYRRESLEAVVATLFAPRPRYILLNYHLEAREVVPLARYEVNWPLLRRGKQAPYRRRSKVQGTAPWEEEANPRLMTLYQKASIYERSLTPHPFEEPVVRLVVAGLDPEQAIRNWYRVARALRAMKRACEA